MKNPSDKKRKKVTLTDKERKKKTLLTKRGRKKPLTKSEKKTY